MGKAGVERGKDGRFLKSALSAPAKGTGAKRVPRGLQLSGGKKPSMRRSRRGGWTAAKKRRFLEVLGSTCNISASLRAVRMSSSGLDKLRARDGTFRAGWAAALREGYARLELMTLERMINGTVKTVTRADGSIDKTHEYPNHIALQLLRMHRDSAAEAEAEQDAEDMDAVRERIIRKLAAVRKRLEKKQSGNGEGAQ